MSAVRYTEAAWAERLEQVRILWGLDAELRDRESEHWEREGGLTLSRQPQHRGPAKTVRKPEPLTGHRLDAEIRRGEARLRADERERAGEILPYAWETHRDKTERESSLAEFRRALEAVRRTANALKRTSRDELEAIAAEMRGPIRLPAWALAPALTELRERFVAEARSRGLNDVEIAEEHGTMTRLQVHRIRRRLERAA